MALGADDVESACVDDLLAVLVAAACRFFQRLSAVLLRGEFGVDFATTNANEGIRIIERWIAEAKG